MTCNRCNKQPCDCNSDPCGKKCHPAKYGCDFDIQVDPFDPSTWIVTTCGAMRKVKVPKSSETDTILKTNYSSATLDYKAERHDDTVTGEQLGSIIKLNELRDVDVPEPENCGILTWNPGCASCGTGCTSIEAQWRQWVIPDAGNNDIAAVDNNGYYHVLAKNDCGCPVEKKVPIVPAGMTSLNFVRDSTPDDPDFPWYYGSYNDTINLHLAENAPNYFNKYALKVTVNYGVQAIKSDLMPSNYHWTSRIVPVIQDDTVRITQCASILDGFGMAATGTVEIPWGTLSMRGSITFIVPKGKEAYLHHEYRVRTNASFPNYDLHPSYDGKKVPDAEAQRNKALYPASRLNALQVIIEPTVGANNYSPVADTVRSQLDSPTDEYPVN